MREKEKETGRAAKRKDEEEDAGENWVFEGKEEEEGVEFARLEPPKDSVSSSQVLWDIDLQKKEHYLDMFLEDANIMRQMLEDFEEESADDRK